MINLQAVSMLTRHRGSVKEITVGCNEAPHPLLEARSSFHGTRRAEAWCPHCLIAFADDRSRHERKRFVNSIARKMKMSTSDSESAIAATWNTTHLITKVIQCYESTIFSGWWRHGTIHFWRLLIWMPIASIGRDETDPTRSDIRT